MAESFANIGFSMLLAIVLIYMVLAAQFESLVHPLTVMLSLPLSVVGALGLLDDRPHAEHLLADRHDHADGAGHQERHPAGRLHQPAAPSGDGATRGPAARRPGAVAADPDDRLLDHGRDDPVAIGWGAGAETRAPMATSIIGGMLTSTILTLVVVPVVYSLLDDAGSKTACRGR
jgi:hydrophobic/amphiphilic exporter-1 (mainly G- bacteria), HAE1 family